MGSSKKIFSYFLMSFFFLSLAGCRAIRPYEKEYLVHPTMDDSRVEHLSGSYGQSMRPSERLSKASGGGSSSSCPTCGG